MLLYIGIHGLHKVYPNSVQKFVHISSICFVMALCSDEWRERREETGRPYFVGGKVEPGISRWVPEARKKGPPRSTMLADAVHPPLVFLRELAETVFCTSSYMPPTYVWYWGAMDRRKNKIYDLSVRQ